MLQVDGMCWVPDIQHESNTNSEIRYLIIETIMLTGFWLFAQLFLSRSVRKPYLRASYHVYILIGSWCAVFPFLPRNCSWLPLIIENILRRGVGNLTREYRHWFLRSCHVICNSYALSVTLIDWNGTLSLLLQGIRSLVFVYHFYFSESSDSLKRLLIKALVMRAYRLMHVVGVG